MDRNKNLHKESSMWHNGDNDLKQCRNKGTIVGKASGNNQY